MEYWTLSEDTIDEIVRRIIADETPYPEGPYFDLESRTAVMRRYFNTELEQGKHRDHVTVVYKKDGVWKHVQVHEQYQVDWVMKHAADKL